MVESPPPIRSVAEAGIAEYLTAMTMLRAQMRSPGGFCYTGTEDFVWRHGQFYASQPLTPAERDYLTAVIRAYGKRCPPKQCFYNSQLLLLSAEWGPGRPPDLVLRYVEGYANSVMPIHHGWLSLNGKVVDPTLRMAEQSVRGPLSRRTVGTFPEDRAYFGVPFTVEEVRASVLQRRAGASLLVDYERDFPFFRQPYMVTP
jgi:hypothetical protein